MRKILLQSALVLILGALLFVAINCQYFWQIFVARTGHLPPAVLVDVDAAAAALPANRLLIPSLNIEAPIVSVEENTEAAFQQGLGSGVVHYPGTAAPGEIGNAYFFGHSSDYVWSKGAYKTVFARLPEIKEDAAIIVTGQAGDQHVYRVKKTLVVSADDLRQLQPSRPEIYELTLQTSYPLGTAWKRFIVRAEEEE